MVCGPKKRAVLVIVLVVGMSAVIVVVLVACVWLFSVGPMIVVPGPPSAMIAARACATPACTKGSLNAVLKLWSKTIFWPSIPTTSVTDVLTC